MTITKRDAVRIAISYADIFDYPLTEEEVRVWTPYVAMRSFHMHVPSAISQRQRRLEAIRKQRERWSNDKWVRARAVGNLLRLIPTILLVGVTGGLARSNAKEEDDIDFIIMTSSNTLWVTRALSTMLLDAFHLRRRPVDTQFKNLICLNMFMSEDGLSLPQAERDLFTAHEVLLMTPLWDRYHTYRTFLDANHWVKKFLPNAWEEKHRALSTKHQAISEFQIRNKPWTFFRYWDLVLEICLGYGIWCLRFVEAPIRIFQLWYMRKRRSTEIVTDTVIRFHPRDARGWIRRALALRLAKYNIPLDKIFYAR